MLEKCKYILRCYLWIATNKIQNYLLSNIFEVSHYNFALKIHSESVIKKNDKFQPMFV